MAREGGSRERVTALFVCIIINIFEPKGENKWIYLFFILTYQENSS